MGGVNSHMIRAVLCQFALLKVCVKAPIKHVLLQIQLPQLLYLKRVYCSHMSHINHHNKHANMSVVTFYN